MVSPVTTAKIFSTLGNNSSLIPLGIKDISNIAGMTTGSYITGDKIEGKDRFIDEAGTLVIWLGGIPFFKKVIDKTVYKLAKFNPNIDTRILQNKKILELAKEHAVIPKVKESFEKLISVDKIASEKNQKIFKNLAVGKFLLSTALTLGSYFALTMFRHKHTEKNIIKEFKKEEERKLEKGAKEAEFKGKQENRKGQKPSFGINMSVLQQFMFDPVKNTMIIDGGITTQRLAESRNPQDLIGYAIKEGGFLAFMYFLGPKVQNYLEKKAAKSHKPIDLDIRILQNEKFQKAIKDGSMKKHLKSFSTTGTDAEFYESLFKGNSNSLIVEMAKESDIIKTTKYNGKHIIDTQQFIDIDQIRGNSKKKTVGITQKIENLSKSLKEYLEKEKNGTPEKFFKDLLKSKRMSIIKNIGFSIGALGLVVPGIMVAARFLNKDNKEFAVKKAIHEKLRKEKATA